DVGIAAVEDFRNLAGASRQTRSLPAVQGTVDQSQFAHGSLLDGGREPRQPCPTGPKRPAYSGCARRRQEHSAAKKSGAAREFSLDLERWLGYKREMRGGRTGNPREGTQRSEASNGLWLITTRWVK